jgi:hypothetical protein
LQTGILEHVGGPDHRNVKKLQQKANLGATVRLIIPKSGNGSGIRAIVRVSNPGEGPGEVRVGLPVIRGSIVSGNQNELPGMNKEFRGGKALSFQVPAGAKELELTALVPAEYALRPGLSVDIRVLATSKVLVEALAFVPLADEIPPPPPEPWKPTGDPNGVGASR